MSTNRKNREKPVLRNCIRSQNITQRSLIALEAKLDNSELRKIVDSINEEIQLINRRVPERNIPYIRIEESKDYFNLDKTRVVLRSETTDVNILSKIEVECETSNENTFLVELYINDNGYVEIGCADNLNLKTNGLSNFILVDKEYLSCALIDIFLDSAIFNSYSFLKELPVEEKRNFNTIKVDFLKDIYRDFTTFDSPFYSFNNKRYQYLSMAFFTRKSEDEIDIPQLIDLWNRFIHQNFFNKAHVEPTVERQLTALVDYEQYTDKIINKCLKLPKGTYWLLRIHKTPVNEDIQLWLKAVFGKTDIGTEKVIPFEQFEAIYELVRGQHITAFKIIVQ